MKGMGTVRKLAVAVAVCMAVLCLPGYSEPTPEQVKERTEMLFEAISYNDVERVKLCIKLGANVNAKDRGYTALMMAIGNGYKNSLLAELLIKAGADVNEKAKETWTSYDDGKTALIMATLWDYKDIVELLINAGADVNAKDNKGETALMKTTIFDQKYDIAELLINAGADVNTKDYFGSTQLIVAVSSGDYEDIAELLIKAGADVNAKDNYGWTALMAAASRGDSKDIAELLIKAGADVNAKDEEGDTALICAAKSGNKDTTELLIKTGADVNIMKNNGSTALMEALIMYGATGFTNDNFRDVAELLIKAGANDDAVVIWAVKESNSNAMKLLIDVGANVNAKDSEGISALDYAILYGKNDIADLLRAAGARE